MRYVIFSDLHDNITALYQVLADAESWPADRLICLGDVGRQATLFGELQARAIPCTFGNWEVSGWRHLPAELAAWVAGWPAIIQIDQALFCHATPDMEIAAATTAGATQVMASGRSWSSLFPGLQTNDEARWQAFAALEVAGARVAFHGHTHVQLAWVWESEARRREGEVWRGGRVRSFTAPNEFVLQPENRYLIGVGSAGAPNDGPTLKYARYDSASNTVTLRQLAA